MCVATCAIGSSRYESSVAAKLSETTDQLLAAVEKLERDLADAPQVTEARLIYFQNVILADMSAARTLADTLETMVDRKYWPFPTYSDILFYM